MSSEQAIYGALAKAQGEFDPVKLNRTNTFFKSKYAGLSAVRAAVTPALSKHGIAVTQILTESEDGKRLLTTKLIHSDGSDIVSTSRLPDVADIQKLGSSLTYLRRYQLSALCGICADEDDDANGAVEVQRAAQQERSKAASERLNNPQPRETKPAKPLKGDGPAKSHSELVAMGRALGADIQAINKDETYLRGVIADNKALIDQGRLNSGQFWNGNPGNDWDGIGPIIDAAYKRVREADQDPKAIFTVEDKVMAG